jgi:flagella synthesis protein FlgN
MAMTIASPSATLRDEQQLIASIVEVMKQEQQLLVSADADGLATLTPEKLKLAQQMGTLSQLRHRALAGTGFAAGETGMEPWLAAGGNGDARADWERLLDLTRQAKELNRVNGMLLNKQLANTTGVLNALRGNAGAATGGVYGASGQTLAAGPSRRFVVG